jgi:uroporphyrinogen decarboxylase
MRALVAVVVPHLRAQADAGASALQVFDSWVGSLAPDDYERSVLPHMRAVFGGVADLEVPVIHFGVQTGELLALMSTAGADAVGVDHRVPLDAAWARVGQDHAVQGNLDPAALLAPWEAVERKAVDVLDRVGGRAGHVFNLGHGVLPPTPVETLQRLVDLVHERSARPRAEEEQRT